MEKSNISILDYYFRFQKSTIDRIAWPYSSDQDSIVRWRALILFSILFVGLVLGSFTLIVAATLNVKEGAWGLVMVDTCGLMLAIALLFVPRLRFEIRASITSLICYIIGLAVILSVGPLSGGPIWLFSFAVLSGILMGNWAAFTAILINAVSLIILGLLLSTGKFGNNFPVFNTPQLMITAGVNFIVLNAIISVSVSALLKGLNESEKRYRLIAKNVADVIWTMDMDFRYTYISPSVYQQRGFTAKEAMDQSLDKVVVPDSLEKAFSLLSKKLYLIEQGDPEGWEPAVFEIEQYCKDGRTIWTSNNAKILPGPDEKPKSILGVTSDITDRKQSEKRLRQSEEKFRTAFKTSPSVITLTSVENGIYADVNDAFTKLLGYTQEEIIGESSLVFNIWNDSKDRDLLISGLKKNGIVENLEADFKGKQGQIINGLMSARTLEIDDKNYLLAATQDLTEIKKNEKERLNLEIRLQQAQKMESIGTLSGGIAHDFNNILFPILGYTEMLLEDVPEDSIFRDSLNKIYAGGLRAKDLVKQILTFSRQGDHQLKLIKIQPIIKEALKLIRSAIPTNIDIRKDIQEDCGFVMADPIQIHQIIMNLTTNAYHAMKETGGKITVTLKEFEFGKIDLINPDMEPGIYACLMIADTGIGMNQELTTKIFDPFFTTKEKGKGTGMGLAVVHGIVNSLGGAIQVYSEPGIGTEFKLYFPVKKISFEKQNIQDKESIHNGTENILLVDDEEDIVTMEKKMLERLGYQVTAHISSVEALEDFRTNPDKFDLVITDMAMPNLPGDKLAVELNKIRPGISILLCTGFSEIMSEEQAASLGITGFLMKPIIMKVFVKKIREILDKNQIPIKSHP
jgi:PAS domain S-box-containing protein